MPADFRLIMISAMYGNGGNTTQRLLDGHPELFAYPFESQIGTKYVKDQYSSMFPSKYRWPVFRRLGEPACRMRRAAIHHSLQAMEGKAIAGSPLVAHPGCLHRRLQEKLKHCGDDAAVRTFLIA